MASVYRDEFRPIAEARMVRPKPIDGGQLDVTSPFQGLARISPSLASRWLGINVGNRRLRTQFVQYLVRCIRNGEWQPDHPQPIVFSDAGRLIDGQHRLQAIVAADAVVVANVVCGARDQLREYLDTGISRTLEDRVEFDPDLNTNRFISNVVSGWHRFVTNSGRLMRITPEEAMETFRANEPAIRFAAAFMARKQRGVCRAPIAVALAQAWQKNSEIAEAFAASLSSPDGSVQPARYLREYAMSNPAGGQMMGQQCYQKAVAAVKAALEGREIKVLRASSW